MFATSKYFSCVFERFLIMASGAQQEIFADVRVIELGQYVAAPVTAKAMADMGADVIKVELPPAGDLTRLGTMSKSGLSASYISSNRGKKGLCIDFKRPEGAAVVRDLVSHADVLLENYTPGVVARYGLSYEALQPLVPQLIMCSISAFGQNGPAAKKPGNDLIAWASSGLLDQVGEAEGSPVYPGGNVADNTAGVHGLAAVASALYFRERTGRGQYIDLSMAECMGSYNSTAIVNYGLSGGQAAPTRTGRFSTATSVYGIFKARDGYVAISVLGHHWATFTQLIAHPQLASDPRFDNHEHRLANHAEVTKLIETWLQSFPTRYDALVLLEKAHILAQAVLDTPGFINDSQIKVRGLIQRVEHPGVGAVPIPRVPFSFSQATAITIRRPAPLLGEHNVEVLSGLLGYSGERIAALRQAGILHQLPIAEQRYS